VLLYARLRFIPHYKKRIVFGFIPESMKLFYWSQLSSFTYAGFLSNFENKCSPIFDFKPENPGFDSLENNRRVSRKLKHLRKRFNVTVDDVTEDLNFQSEREKIFENVERRILWKKSKKVDFANEKSVVNLNDNKIVGGQEVTEHSWIRS